MLFKIALRNILRNRRRSAMTGLAVAVGATALLVFGGDAPGNRVNLVRADQGHSTAAKAATSHSAADHTAFGSNRLRDVHHGV